MLCMLDASTQCAPDTRASLARQVTGRRATEPSNWRLAVQTDCDNSRVKVGTSRASAANSCSHLCCIRSEPAESPGMLGGIGAEASVNDMLHGCCWPPLHPRQGRGRPRRGTQGLQRVAPPPRCWHATDSSRQQRRVCPCLWKRESLSLPARPRITNQSILRLAVPACMFSRCQVPSSRGPAPVPAGQDSALQSSAGARSGASSTVMHT
jgi:hypothetical protein